jgi:hypothetical protein
MLEDIELTGFLKGKLYGDFQDEANYEVSLDAVLRALGPVEAQVLVPARKLRILKA